METKSSFIGLLALVLASSALLGCAEADPKYKIEGPTATGNPSVGAPVSDGTAPEGAPSTGAEVAPAIGAGKGKTNDVKARGR